MKYRANSQDTWHKIKVKALDGMPVGSIVEYDGQVSDIPSGWEQVSGQNKIKKITETAPTQASVVGTYNNSQTDSYSCDYINKNIVYSSSEQDTGTKWINGKTIYRKCFTGTGTSTGGDGSTEEISTGITNIEDIVRLYGTYSDSDGIITEQLGGYLNNLDNASFLYFDGSSAKIKFSRGGSWKYGKYNIVIEYTKTTD